MEDYSTWSGALPGVWGFLQNLLTTGGVLFLIAKAIIDRPKTKEEIKAQQTENVDKAVAYGIPMIQIYKEVDAIVEKKTQPILTELKEQTARIKDLEDNYCCYRDQCDFRIRNRADATQDTAHETWKEQFRKKDEILQHAGADEEPDSREAPHREQA